MNFLPYILILVSTSSSLCEGLLVKKYNSRHSHGGFLFTAMLSSSSVLFFMVRGLLSGGLEFETGSIVFGLIAGVLYCAASFLTYVALSCGSFALTSLIVSYASVLTILYGLIWLKEPATVYTYLGFLLIFVSLYLTRAKKEAEKQRVTWKWLLCAVISAFGSGMFGVLSREQQLRYDNRCDDEFMIVSLCVSALCMLIVSLVKERKHIFQTLKYGSHYALGAGVSNGVTNGLGMVINTMMAFSIAAPTRTAVKVILSFVVSKFVFKEQFLKRQIWGVIVGGAALILLNL